MMELITTRRDDAELLCLYAEQHAEEAFSELVGRHIGLVHSAALRQVAGDAAAADITQAVFVELARRATPLARHPALIGWLYTTTHRMSAHYVRDEARRRRLELEAHAMQELHRADRNGEPNWDRFFLVIDAAMHDLCDTDRIAVLLRFFSQRPFAEIGARLGMSENGARMRVDRALEKLRAKLEERGVTSTASVLATALASPALMATPTGLAATITSTAIAAATTTTSTLQLSALMAFTKLKFVSIAAALAIAGTAIVLQNRAGYRLRGENDSLQQQVKQLTEEAQAARQSANLNSEELARLRQSQAELVRLRGEVARLRSENTKLAASSPTSPTAGVPRPESLNLADVGTDTPENSALSLMWAITKQKKEKFIELVKFPDDVSQAQAAKLYDELFNRFTKGYSRWQFNSLVNIRVEDDGAVLLHFGYRDLDTGNESTLSVTLRKYNFDWKVVIDDVPRGNSTESGTAP